MSVKVERPNKKEITDNLRQMKYEFLYAYVHAYLDVSGSLHMKCFILYTCIQAFRT